MDRLRVSEQRLNKAHTQAKARLMTARRMDRSNPDAKRRAMIKHGLEVVRLEVFLYGEPHNNYVKRVWYLHRLAKTPG